MSSIIGFRALQIANEQQSAYGLRYDDFTRYRKHCANRTHRLRSSLKMTHSSPRGRDFKKLPPLTEMDLEKVKEGHLHLLLLESERAWAYAQELTASSLQPANSEHSASLRHHATGRFRRAINWATQLLSLSQSLYTSGKLTAESLLEATAYVLLLNGRFLLSREDFESALPQLCVTRFILDILAEHAGTSKDHALAVLWADQVGPMIRWSAHQMGRERAYDVDSIVAELAKQHVQELVGGWNDVMNKFKEEVERGDAGKDGKKGTGKAKLDEDKLMWEGEKVPVRNPELVDVLLKVQSAQAKLTSSTSANVAAGTSNKGNAGKKAVAAYDAILAALSDAEEVARKLRESEAQKATSSTIPTNLNPNGQVRDMHFVHTYIVYQLLSKRIQRDLLLVDALTQEAETTSSAPSSSSISAKGTKKTQQVDPRVHPAIVKLLDTILQSLTQMRTLSIVDDNPDLSASVDGRIGWTKARRCLSLARCYVVPGIKKYAESLTLLQHASVHLREVRQLASALDYGNSSSNGESEFNFFPLSSRDLDSLEESIAKEGLEYKRAWLERGADADNDNDDRKGLGGGGGRGEKQQKKPVFFNIALNYIDVDVDRLRERAGKAPLSTQSNTAPVPAKANPTSSGKGAMNAGGGGTPLSVAQAQRKALAESMSRSGTPEPRELPETAAKQAGTGGSRLGSLLGGWWGRS